VITNMTEALATAQTLGYRAFHAGLWPENNPFRDQRLRQAWQAAWNAENHKEIERLRQNEPRTVNLMDALRRSIEEHNQ